jgi:hypothetical protein
MLLVLKLVLVPALVVSASLAGRRWGPRMAGLLTSFPIVTGPALLFFVMEQGDSFAAEAALGALVALAAVAASGVAYARACLRTPWWISLPASWASFVLVTLALEGRGWAAPWALAVAIASFVLAWALLPATPGAAAPTARSRWDLPLRTLAAMVLVLTVTGLARRLGPALSGAFTPFPVALGVLLAFTHAQQGSSSAIQFMRGFLPGMLSFAVFCFVAALAIVPLGGWLGLLVALLSVFPIQAVALWWMPREPTPRPRPADIRRARR